ncbi:ankyrin repeat-containing domain protein [Aspergillus fruticulosus]
MELPDVKNVLTTALLSLLILSLHYAVVSGSSECVFHLLQAGANPNAQDHRGMTPLHIAAQRNVSVVEPRLKRRDLKFPYAPIKRYGLEGMQPLMDLRSKSPICTAGENIRAAVGHDEEVQMVEDIIRLLITAGADPDIRDSSAWSAYDLSVFISHESAARILQPATNRGEKDQALLERWCSVRANCANQIVQGLTIDNTGAYTLLHTAICQKDEALLEALLAAGADPTIPGPDALTPVNYAAFWSLVSVMKTMARYIKDWNEFRPPLLHAAASREHSNIQMVHLLVARVVDVNARFETYPEEFNNKYKYSISPAAYTVAHMLATGQRWWYFPALDVLCKAGADLEATDSRGRTVLQCVLAERRAFWQNEILDVVLGHGANINFRSPKDGSTALLDALRSRQSYKVIERLLHFGADLNAGKVPAIIVAVESKDVRCLKAVLDAGADPNTLYRPDRPRYFSDGPRAETPLMAAALADTYGWPESHSSSKVPLVSLLLERGADPLRVLSSEETKAGTWTTVFHEICHYHGLVSLILSTTDINLGLDTVNGDGVTPLLIPCRLFKNRASEHGDSTPRHLILAGANIHATDPNGSTPLHLAVRSGLCSIVTLLLEKGASVSATDNAGYTPLHYALGCGLSWEKAAYGQLRLIKSLIEAGADPTLVIGPNGASALHLLAPLLVQFSPAGTYESNYNFQAMIDYFPEYKALYDLFINRGCDRGGRDNDGATPLFHYVQEVKAEDEEIDNVSPAEDDILLMLELHDIFGTNNHGDTLLHVVAGRPDTERSENDAPRSIRKGY